MRGKTVAIIVALAAVISGGAIAATFLTAGSDGAETRALVPEDAFLYMEGSRQLSDDQRAACDALATHFPEGSDCGAIRDQVRAALDSQLAAQNITFEGDIEPWLGNDFVFFMTSDNLAEMVQQSQTPPQVDVDENEDFDAQMEEFQENLVKPTLAALVTVDDEAGATEFIQEMATKGDTEFEEKAYENVDYFYEGGGAWAVLDSHLVVGTEEGVKAVIDQREAESTIDDSERFSAALDSVRDERLAMAYADLQPVLDAFRVQLQSVPPGLVGAFEDVVEQPLTATAYLEDDAAVVEMTSNGALHDLAGYAIPGGGGEDALARLPAGSWGAIAMDDAAGQVNSFLQLGGSAIPGGAVVLEQQFKQSTGLDLQQDVLEWMGPSALFIGGEKEADLYGGMTIDTSDPSTTARTILQIERLLARDGTPTEIITRSGFRGFMSEIPGESRVAILAVDDERAVGLFGPPELLDELADGETLGSSGRVDEIKGIAGEGFAIGTFFDIDIVREMIEGSVPPDAEYMENIRPFLAPLDLFVYGSAQEDGVARDRYVVNVDE